MTGGSISLLPLEKDLYISHTNSAVEFANEGDMEEAIRLFDDYDYNGSRITVKKAGGAGGRSPPPRSPPPRRRSPSPRRSVSPRRSRSPRRRSASPPARFD